MAKSAKRPTRYRSTLRAAQAKNTKARIVRAASDLFATRGFAGTTVTAVADLAGVAPETVYSSFGNKRVLLEGVVAHAIQPGAASHDDAVAEIATLGAPEARLVEYVRFCSSTLARTSPVHHIVRGAADKEPFAIELRARLLAERLANQTRHLAILLGDVLPAFLKVEAAAERFCALSSPEMYYLLTVELGWSTDAYSAWLAELAVASLLPRESITTKG